MLKIGSLKLDNKAIAAPMAGFTDRAWRILACKMGAGLVISEMVSVEGLWRGGKKTREYLENDKRARPFGLQLFGAEPESFVKALDVIAKLSETRRHPCESRDLDSCFRRNDDVSGFDLIDINMGCPVRKVVKKGAGSALMKTPEKAGKIVAAVRRVYNGPLTVKMRAGWNSENINATDMAKIAESEGADAIIVHPRTQSQFFKGDADWSIIKDVKDAVKIPVIGNGDIIDKESYDQMISETGCDGVMIGREAIKNPWIFRVITGGKPPTTEEILQTIKDHLDLLKELEDEHYATNIMRKFIAKYLKGINGSKPLISELYKLKSTADIWDRVQSVRLDGLECL